MDHQKMSNLLTEENDCKFITRKWNTVNDNSQANYNVSSEIIYNTEILKSSICDYNNAYILARGNITIMGHQVTQVAFESCAPFTKYITKFDGTKVDDVEDLDLVLTVYNLIEFSSNYSEAAGCLWFYSKDEANNFNVDIANNNNNNNNNNNFKTFYVKG